jgi:hypothetical protein
MLSDGSHDDASHRRGPFVSPARLTKTPLTDSRKYHCPHLRPLTLLNCRGSPCATYSVEKRRDENILCRTFPVAFLHRRRRSKPGSFEMGLPQSFRLRRFRKSRRDDFGTLACRPVSQTPPAPAQPPTPSAQPSTPSTQPPAQPAPAAASDSDSPATVYFYRAKRFQGSALKPSVFVDDAAVGNLHNGDSLKFALKSGKHRIYSTDKSTGIDLEVKPGETYYVRVDILVGFWKGHGGVTLVDPQQGKYETRTGNPLTSR